MADVEGERPRWVWLMGFSNTVYGFGYAAVLVTTPQKLAAEGMGEPAIAGLTALALGIVLATFALAPILDTLMSRRAWALILALVSAALAGWLLSLPASSPLIPTVLCAAALTLSLYNAAVGGWLGAALPKSCDQTLGAWFNIGNAFGFGVGAITQFWLLKHLPGVLGPVAIAVGVLIPLAVLPVIPASDSGRRAVHESFGNLARDLAGLVRQGAVVRIVLLFALPCAAFTLTNAFGGLGRDFRASDGLVGAANGAGAVLVGLATALIARQGLKHAPAPYLYLATGCVGAAFTLLLVVLPKTPLVYLLAVLGENAAQTAAQVSQNAIVFRSIRQGSPLAASQYGLLGTAAVLPYAYMQGLDGFGYRLAHGVTGSFLMDAGLSLAACAAVFVPVILWMRAGRLEAAG